MANETVQIEKNVKDAQLIIKKSTLKAWALELFQMNKIDEKRYVKMAKMIEDMKQ